MNSSSFRFGVSQSNRSSSALLHSLAPGETEARSASLGLCLDRNFRHPPNLDSIFWSGRKLASRSRELPLGRNSVYGAYPPARYGAS